jgi:CBS domain-containing protein
MRVRDAMSANVISVAAQATILEAARTMLRNRVSGLPVVDAEGQLVGMVTEGDFLRRSEIGGRDGLNSCSAPAAWRRTMSAPPAARWKTS